MISAEEARWIIQAFIGANNPSMKDSDPAIWQMSLNSATTSGDRPTRLDPSFRECQAAALRLINRGEDFPNPGKVAAEVERGRTGDVGTRKARIEEAIGNRAIYPEWVDDDPDNPMPAEESARLDSAWKQALYRAVGDGLDLEAAQVTAYAAVGRTPPPQLPASSRPLTIPRLRKA